MRNSDRGLCIPAPLGPPFADGADVVDHVTEILLPGRTVAATTGDAPALAAGVTLPSFVAGPENRLVATAVTALLGRRRCARRFAARAVDLGTPRIERHRQDASRPRTGAPLANPSRTDSAEYFTAVDFRRELPTPSIATPFANSATRSAAAGCWPSTTWTDCRTTVTSSAGITLHDRRIANGRRDDRRHVLATSSACFRNLPPDSAAASHPASTFNSRRRHGRSRTPRRQFAAALGPLHQRRSGRPTGQRHRRYSERPFRRRLRVARRRADVGHDEREHAERLLADRAARRPTLREITAVVAKYFRQPQTVLKALPPPIGRAAAGDGRLSGPRIGRMPATNKSAGPSAAATIPPSCTTTAKVDRDRQHDLAIQEALTELRRILISR